MRPLPEVPLFGEPSDSRTPKPLRGEAQYPDVPGFKAAGGAAQEAAAALTPIGILLCYATLDSKCFPNG
jgi:hypothetical protein